MARVDYTMLNELLIGNISESYTHDMLKQYLRDIGMQMTTCIRKFVKGAMGEHWAIARFASWEVCERYLASDLHFASGRYVLVR